MRLIDADALKKAVEGFPNCYNGWSDTYGKAFIIGAIEEAPTIDIPHTDDWEKYSERLWKTAYERGKADRPQGEWIDAEIPLESGGAMPIQACSLCKTFYPLAYTGGGHRFCPNCGARMKGADDE